MIFHATLEHDHMRVPEEMAGWGPMRLGKLRNG